MNLEQSGITGMIEQRLRDKAKPIANQAAIDLEAKIIAHLDSIGVSCHFHNIYSFIDQVRTEHTNVLVNNSITALVDGLMAEPSSQPMQE